MAIRRLRCTNYKVLNDEQIYRIHLGVLQVLEEVGMFIEHDGALKIFADNGCKVDFDKRRVYITSTRLDRDYVPRLAILSFRTHGRHVRAAVEDVVAAAHELEET